MKIKYKEKKISNWSNTINLNQNIFYPKNLKELIFIIERSKYQNKKISFIGSGNSYGDCFFSKSIVISLKYFNKVLEFNRKKLSITVQSGMKLKNLINLILPKKLIINSLPGTYNASLGGCVASNVHGKDSHINGVFGNNIIEITVLDKNLNIKKINFNDPKIKKFVGTYGLHGAILEVKLKLKKISSNCLKVNTIKFSSFEKCIALFNEFSNSNYVYMGAWIDHFSKKNKGIFKAAKWDKKFDEEIPKKIGNKKNFFFYIKTLFLYKIAKTFLINRYGIKFLNYFLYYLTKDKHNIHTNFFKFYYPQENILPEEWRLFPNGKVNIQILIDKKNPIKEFKRIHTICKKYNYESWWLGIKKHKKSKFNSFDGNGFDITLQWSKKHIGKSNFKYFYKELYRYINKNNYKIYLTQDILLSSNSLRNNYLKSKINKNKFSKNLLFSNFLYERIF